MNTQDLLNRTDQLITMGDSVVATASVPSARFKMSSVNLVLMTGFRSASLSFIKKLYGNNHPYFQQFTASTVSSYKSSAQTGIEILKSIREEISGGWLSTIKNLVTAEIFADFITMAEHLLSTDYKDAAAVMAGSVLEEHLRQLCIKNAIQLVDIKPDGREAPRRADRLNAELVKSNIYNLLDNKNITAWLELRNNAAHGKYQEYTSSEVKHMIDGILGFVARIPL